MKSLLLFATLFFHVSIAMGDEAQPEPKLLIKTCDSGITYPDKGDEYVKTTYGDTIYHVKIIHPRITEGPHFSSPYFWTSEKDEEDSAGDYASMRSHIGGLTWHRIKGYFFAEIKGSLRGYFLEDGYDNWDDGSAGLVILHDGKQWHSWKWRYDNTAYTVKDANDASKDAPEELVKRIKEVMDQAKIDAGGWPGP